MPKKTNIDRDNKKLNDFFHTHLISREKPPLTVSKRMALRFTQKTLAKKYALLNSKKPYEGEPIDNLTKKLIIRTAQQLQKQENTFKKFSEKFDNFNKP